MGFGMGAANGACIGTGRKTVLFTGDGSFAMNFNELGTAVLHHSLRAEDTLTVGETVNPQVSRMTIMITGNDHDRDQMIKQLRKLHDVHFVKEMVAEKSVCRELVLLKVGTDRFFVCGGRKKTDIAEEKGASPTAFDRICKEEMVSL